MGFENDKPLNFRCACHGRSPAQNRSISRNERPDTLNPCIKSIRLSNVNRQLPSFPFGCYTNPEYMDIFSAVLTVGVNELAWLSEHPMHGRKVRKPPASRGRVRFLSPEEQERLLQACRASHKPGLYPLVFLALTTGARRGELFSLRWQSVDLERGWLRLEQTKNKESRAVPVPTVALELLRTWRQEAAETAWVFPRTCRAPFPYEYAWHVALLRAGLAGSFRFHDLRHTAASHLAMSGASLIEIAEILGHKTLAMVRRYSHFTQAHTQGVIERMAQQFVHRHHSSQEGAPHAEL